jgi:hypothetical protein
MSKISTSLVKISSGEIFTSIFLDRFSLIFDRQNYHISTIEFSTRTEINIILFLFDVCSCFNSIESVDRFEFYFILLGARQLLKFLTKDSTNKF